MNVLNYNKHHNNQGFTLIEVIIALAILTIGILSMYSLQLTSIKGNTKASHITEASGSARDQIEQLIGTKFTDATQFSTGNHSVAYTPTAINPVSSVNWTVADWSSDLIDNDKDGQTDEFDERGVKSIQITVQYLDAGITKSSTIQFLKTEIF